MDRPPLIAYPEFAALIDYALLDPVLTNEQVVEGLGAAKRLGVACAVVRPCDIDLAVRTLAGSAVKPGSVAGFPHGSQNTATKLYEVRDLLRRGAREMDVVIAISGLRSREFQHVQTELQQIADACHKEGAVVKVILEMGYLTEEQKIIACRCCEAAEADFVQTSTGFSPAGYTPGDVKLLRKYLPEETGIKTAGGLPTVDEVLAEYEAGVSRVGTAGAPALLDEWKARVAAAPATPASSGA